MLLLTETWNFCRLAATFHSVSPFSTAWYKGRFGFDDRTGKGFYGDSWKLLAELRVQLVDGTEQVIGTDESWQRTDSTITFSNIYDGEHRDDTLPEKSYHFIEVMACPGGCVMGGGQPIYGTKATRVTTRRAGLYAADGNIAIKKSNENPLMDVFYNGPFKDKTHELLHTSHHE